VKGRLTATTTPARRVFRGRTLADVSVAGGSKEEGLTVIRMLPVFLCLIGMRTSVADKLFIGWFGPRGLATIVFAVLVLDEKLPGNDHNNAGGRLDRLAPCYRARRNCESAGRRWRGPGPTPRTMLELPGENEADVAGHSSRIFEDFSPEPEPERPQVIAPEFVAELGSTLQSAFPFGQGVIDPSAAVATQEIWKR
jgi:hypothetical protein